MRTMAPNISCAQRGHPKTLPDVELLIKKKLQLYY